MTQVRARVVVTGVVQGVAFRANTRQMARGRGLSGWVRNLDDGGVEAVFQGPREGVEGAVAWCRCGPPAARVDHCVVSWEPPGEEPNPFVTRYS